MVTKDMHARESGHIGLRARTTLDESPEAMRQVRLAIARAKEGDREALRLLYVRYSDNVYGYVRCIVRDEKEAEDLTQHVFLKLITVIVQVRRPRHALLGLAAAAGAQRRARSPAPAPGRPRPRRCTAPTHTPTRRRSTARATCTPRSTRCPRSSAT